MYVSSTFVFVFVYFYVLFDPGSILDRSWIDPGSIQAHGPMGPWAHGPMGPWGPWAHGPPPHSYHPKGGPIDMRGSDLLFSLSC